MYNGQKNHQEKVILKAQEFIEKNIHEKISTDKLAKISLIGRRTFERRFKHATNNSLLEYIQRVTIKAAKRQFETSRKNINELCMMLDIQILKPSAI